MSEPIRCKCPDHNKSEELNALREQNAILDKELTWYDTGGAAELKAERDKLREENLLMRRDYKIAIEKLDQYREALENIKRDFEICSFECECGRSTPMKETDAYGYARAALQEKAE